MSGNKGKSFKALFVFPPQWNPQNPFYAMASLAGHLRSHGYEVALRDLNVEYYDLVLTPQYLQSVEDRLKLDYEYLYGQGMLRNMMGDTSLTFQIEGKRYIEIKKFFQEQPGLIQQLKGEILAAKETLRDPRRFYNPDMLMPALDTIDSALEVIALPYFPAQFSYNFFHQPTTIMATRSLIEYAGNRSNNMFYDYFQSKVAELLAEKANYIGISINSFSQVLPGVTLASMLHKAAPEGTTVAIGGNFFSRVKEALKKRPEFFENFCDVVACGEGEEQMRLLMEALSEGKGYEGVPNLLYLDGGEVKETAAHTATPMDQIGLQDFAGLPLDKYFTPELVASVQASKGCYWGKCTFCDTDFGITHDVKSLDRLVEEINHLKNDYGVKHFQFIDEAIPPETMREMANRFIEEKLDVQWFTNGRLEKGFTPELMQLLHQAGLRLILWGYESGSTRIMRMINKGIDIRQRHNILRGSAKAGIWNFAYIFFGFPTETGEEAMSTIDAMWKHQDFIHSYGRSVFSLGKHSTLFLKAKKFGIIDVIHDPEELSSNLHYKTTIGMDAQEADEMMRKCSEICYEKFDSSLWFFLRYRENIHLYVSKFGLDYVRKAKYKSAWTNSVLSNLEAW
ncbi:MAG TPA: hypothetical protein DD435_15160 [Cyanobacteria bacterium UBA8530]|nr:hypothetical protein [Cyanobacteria bacterium UBA8530]